MDWKAFFIFLPINAALIYNMYREVKDSMDLQEQEEQAEEELREKKRDNLRSEVLEIELDEEETEMLAALKAIKREKSTHKYLRSALKHKLDLY